jgi:hypothetical protein
VLSNFGKLVQVKEPNTMHPDHICEISLVNWYQTFQHIFDYNSQGDSAGKACSKALSLRY